jgi:RimJ/RimL family protein N-acetyltransferase
MDPITVRQATLSDAELLFQWRNDPLTIAGSRSGKGVEWASHVHWLSDQLLREDRTFLIGMCDNVSCGLVWFSLNGGGVWETSVSLDNGFRGRGVATKLLLSAIKWMTDCKDANAFSTEIGDDNLAAIRMYERCGFRYVHPSPGFGIYFASFAGSRSLFGCVEGKPVDLSSQ